MSGLTPGSRDRTIKLWALESCHLVRSVDLLHPVISLCVVGEVLFVSTSMSSVQALDVQALRKIRCGKLVPFLHVSVAKLTARLC